MKHLLTQRPALQTAISFYRRFLTIVCIAAVHFAHARIDEQEMEQERLSGYKDQIVERQIYDRERLRAYRAYLEELEKEAFEKQKAIKEYRKEQVQKTVKNDESERFEVFNREKQAEIKLYEANRVEYVKNQKKNTAIEARRDFTEEEELDIFVDRPRYNYKRRALYGAKPKYKIATAAGGSKGSSGGPPPPPDFGTDSGYIPPPPPPMVDMPNEPFYDEIPPPPPPPPPLPNDFGGIQGGDTGEGYIPPPPPPPPMFDGEF